MKVGKKPTLEQFYAGQGTLKEDEEGYYLEKIIYTTNEHGETNESIEMVRVDDLSNFSIENKAVVNISNLAIDIETNTVKNKVIDANFDIEITTSHYEPKEVGDTYEYIIVAKNISGKDLEEVNLNNILPEELKYIGCKVYSDQEFDYSNINYNESTKELDISLGDIRKSSSFQIIIEVEAVKPGAKEDNIVNNYITLSAKGEKAERSSNISKVIKGPKLYVTQKNNLDNNYVLEGEEVEFIVTIENTGKGQANNLKIMNTVSSGLENIEIEYSGARSGKQIYQENENVQLSFNNIPGESIILLKIRGTATEVNSDDEKIISNQAIVSADYLDMVYSENIEVKIKNNVNKVNTENKENPSTNNNSSSNSDNNTSSNNNQSSNTTIDTNNSNNNSAKNTTTDTAPTTEKIYSISGIVWLDENKNGQKDEGEELLIGIKVQLYKSGNMIRAVTTDGNGKYVFNELNNGNYSTVFTYESEVYTTTTYKKIGVDETINSDAVETRMGTATSNNIVIENDNVDNINLGLINKDKFDLSISKYITKAILNTNSGVKEYDYKDLQLAKLEISTKELKTATVEMVYKIVVENVGTVAGNVTKVIDTLPNGVTFSESKNTGWYLGNDGKIYYEGLKETKIEAGEKKEITLVLSKKMTEENTGVVSNKVEISETLNTYGLKEDNDQNIATQEFIISVKTGKVIQITIIISVMTVLCIFVYIKLNRKIDIKSGLKDKFKFNLNYKNKPSGFKHKRVNIKKFYK